LFQLAMRRGADEKAPPYKIRRTGHPKFNYKARATRPEDVFGK